uniref:Uncharacterized protein n=1 Tax=Rhizophora mucronata TaxID=61149 RepID=A0A2P2PTC4_RHIMU
MTAASCYNYFLVFCLARLHHSMCIIVDFRDRSKRVSCLFSAYGVAFCVF